MDALSIKWDKIETFLGTSLHGSNLAKEDLQNLEAILSPSSQNQVLKILYDSWDPSFS
jgi:hypothetical protein